MRATDKENTFQVLIKSLGMSEYYHKALNKTFQSCYFLPTTCVTYIKTPPPQRRALHELFPTKDVPHQISAGLEILRNYF